MASEIPMLRRAIQLWQQEIELHQRRHRLLQPLRAVEW
jgi:hypothetical protein